MLEAILIGIVILLAFIILLIITIGAIKALKKKNKVKSIEESNNESVTPIEEKVERLLEQESFDLELENDLLDINKNDIPEIKKQMETMSVTENLVINLNQGEGIVIGEGEYPCGKYLVEITNGENVVKIRTSRYVNMYDNGATIVFETKQKVTPISASVSLKKID